MSELTKMLADLDVCEKEMEACRKEFEDIIDATLDGFNDKEVSKDAMKRLIKVCQQHITEADIEIKETKEIRKFIMKQIEESE